MLRARIRMFGSRMVVLLATSRYVACVQSGHATVCLPYGSSRDMLDSLVLELTTRSARKLRSAVAPDTGLMNRSA